VTATLAACGVLPSVPPVSRASDDLSGRLAADLDAAFPEVLAAYGGAVYGVALRTTRTPQHAEDLAAETFLRAYAALRRYPAAQVEALSLRPWLVTILLNIWRNEVRAASRRPGSVPLDESIDAPATEAGPDAVAATRDIASRLAELMTSLPERQRLAVVLRHVGELSYVEIGVALGMPEGTARSHVSRGLRTLRALAVDAGLQEAL
jgi:RNA polymerase sigma-70 factor, ECF subfamily